MRVAHVITRLIVGGAQENTAASVLGLAAKPGWEPELISGPTTGPEGSIAGLFAGTNLLTIAPNLVRALHPWRDWRALHWLERRFRRTAPAIVHTHSGKAGILGRLAAQRAGVPVIIHTIHGPSFGPFQGAVANLLFRSAERRAGRRTTMFVSVAEAMTRQYVQAGIAGPERFRRIFSGFDTRSFSLAGNDPGLRARLGIGPEDLVVGKIARLFRLKGHDDLLAVAPGLARRFPRLRFLLVGDGAWRGRLEKLVRAAGLERHFIFAGLAPPDEVHRYVGIMDILVHLSLREGLPRALPQAMAAGRPVVAYDCDGAREVCLDGQTGFLVPPADLAALSERLGRLLADETLRRKLGANGRKMALELFPTERMVDALEGLYLELLARRPAAQIR